MFSSSEMLRYCSMRFRGRQLCLIPAVVICLVLLYLFRSSGGLQGQYGVSFIEPKPRDQSPSIASTTSGIKDQAIIGRPPTAAESSDSPLDQSRPLISSNSGNKKEESSINDATVHSQSSHLEDISKSSADPLVDQSPPPRNTTLGSDSDMNEPTEYVALCLVVQNKALDLNEWLIHHYQHVGISHFYIMDNGSIPPLSKIELPLSVPKSAVTFQYFDAASRVDWMELHLYDQCVKLHGHKHKWMGFIDTDEFIQVKGAETLKSLLHDLEMDQTVGALAMNREIHTSGGLLTRPYSTRKSYTTCVVDQEDDRSIAMPTDMENIKSIVKTEFFESPDNPYKMYLKKDTVTVGEYGDRVDGKAWRFPISRERISLHYYAVRSKAEFEERIQKSKGGDDVKGWELWDQIHSMTTRPCNDLVVYDP